MSLAEAKAHLSEVVNRVGTQHERVLVTVHGTPSAVLIAPADLEALEETIAVLSDGDTVARLAASEAELAAGLGSLRPTSLRLCAPAGSQPARERVLTGRPLHPGDHPDRPAAAD